MKKSSLILLYMLFALAAMADTYVGSYYTIAPETVQADVNHDSSVNAADVTALYAYILNGDETYIATSDVNGDNSINAADVTAVYNIILNSNFTTSITMNDYIDVDLPTPKQHIWQNYTYGGQDVIYITIDGVEANMYRLYRNENRWKLTDVTGSNRAGFGTSGTIKAIWVRHGSPSTDKVGSIDIPYDYALGSGTYTRNGSTVGIQLNLNLAESRVEFTGTHRGSVQDLTFCSHVSEVFDINRMCEGLRTEFVCSASSISPVKYLDGNRYYIFGNNTDIQNNKTQLHCTLADSRSYTCDARCNLQAGECLSIKAPLDNNNWSRDFRMRFYDGTSTKYVKPGLVFSTRLNVGTEITFFPSEGGVTIYDGTTTSRSSSNTDVVSISASAIANSTTCKAKSVGNSVIMLTYETPSGDTFNFTIIIYVDPTLWIAGASSGKQVLLRNSTVMKSDFNSNINTIDRVFVRKGEAYLKADTESESLILRCTNPQYSTTYNTRYTIPKIPHDLLFVNRNAETYYFFDYKFYKNNSLLWTPSNYYDIRNIIEDESTGLMWASGTKGATSSSNVASSEIYGVLIADLDNSRSILNASPERITIPVGGNSSQGETTSGYRSQHFKNISIQNGFVLIDAYLIKQSCWRPMDPSQAYQWGNSNDGDATYTYDSHNGYIKQCTRGIGNYFFFDNTNTSMGENVYCSKSYSGLEAYYLRSGASVDIPSSVPASSIKAVKYYQGKIYGVGYDKIYIIDTTKSPWTCDKYPLNITLSTINDIFLETTEN